MAKTLKGLNIPFHPKAKAVQKTPLARTSKGMAGITPVGVTGHQNRTNEGSHDGGDGGHMPKHKSGGKSKGHKVPISFNFPEMRSAKTAQGMGSLGAQPGGMTGVNPPFKEGSVAGKKAKNARSMKGY